MIILNNYQEIFDSFKQENMIALMEVILNSLEIIQDKCRVNIKTQKSSIMDNNNNHMKVLI